jgi:hypothetical protein
VSVSNAVRELGQPIVVRGDEGRWRRYPDPSVLRPYHIERKPQPIDRERCALVKQRDALVQAERNLRTMFIISELTLGDLGFSRFRRELCGIEAALNTVRCAMNLTWDRLGLAPEELS